MYIIPTRGIKMPSTPQILVVDDDPMFCQLVELILSAHGYAIQSVHTADALHARLRGDDIEAIILDWRLGDDDGLTVLQALRAEHPTLPVVLATATCSTDLAVSAIRAGAFDFLTKPLDEARLVATIARAVDQHKLLDRVSELEAEGQSESAYEGLLGISPLMRTVFRVIQNIAPADVSVLITGETGTGKELVARAIHQRSGRAGKPFVPLNMAALPSELVEATLFGHEKGAFTGADRRRIGAVEEAQGGTLFLDEIGEMPLDLQAKLLRFIQERVFRRVGGAEDTNADIRVVSATNRNPLDEVKTGKLRADLYYRLNVVPVELPPLRDRYGDIALIALHCLREFAAKYDKPFLAFDDDVLLAMEGHAWPGNVRELRHFVERLVILNSGPRIQMSMLPDGFRLPVHSHSVPTVATPKPSPKQSEPGAPPAGHPSKIIPIEELERRAIEHALLACNGSTQEAASRLGMSTATIYRKIKHFGIQNQRR
jgi:DNA-binding NtrC family response regulator